MPMKFKPLEQTAEIPWKDGAVLKVRRPSKKEERKHRKKARELFKNELGAQDPQKPNDELAQAIGEYLIEQYLVGWTGIDIDDEGTQLPFTPENREAVYERINKPFDDETKECLRQFQNFVGGIEKNSKAGLTSSTTTGGTSKPAVNASENTTKPESPGPVE